MKPRKTYASEETMLLMESVAGRLERLEATASDHAQRFDTLQTPWPRRIWFWVQGWPWYNLNGTKQRRPWHRKRRTRRG